MKNLQKCTILGVPVAQVTYEDMLCRMLGWIMSTDKRPHTVIAANVHVITEAHLNLYYRKAVLDADIVMPDGLPLVWASRMLGSSLRTRCYGPTLMEKTLNQFQKRAVRHYLYGSTAETQSRLVTVIGNRWPEAVVTGNRPPPFGEFDDRLERQNIEIMNAANPDIIWVAMGCPKQELWMHRYRHFIEAPVVVAVGAAFDFIAGTVKQAPRWLQLAGLEWLYRLTVEPRRLWRRYLIRNPYFVFRFAGQLLRRKDIG